MPDAMGKVRISSRRARELIRQGKPHLAKLGRAGAELRFDHAGIACPACGYVFTRGVTPVDDAGGKLPELRMSPNPLCPAERRMTVCTRCKRPLYLEDGALRALDAIELAQLSSEERRAIEFMRGIAREHMGDAS